MEPNLPEVAPAPQKRSFNFQKRGKKKTQLQVRKTNLDAPSKPKLSKKRLRERAAKRVIRESALEKRFEEQEAAHEERETAVREQEESLNVREKELRCKEREVNRKVRELEKEREKDQCEQTKRNLILGKTKKKLVGANEKCSLLEKKIARQQAYCKTNCITIHSLPDKDFSKLGSAAAKKARREHFLSLVKELQTKLKMDLTEKEEDMATKYWNTVYGTVPVGADAESECRDAESERTPNEKATEEWEKKWKVLFKLRAAADKEGSVSSAAMRRVFMAAEICGINGGKLDRLKTAMDRSIATRIQQFDISYGEGDEHGGMWLDPQDVVREMLVAAGAKPGAKYSINVLADGRCFGDARNTTFFALRIVFLEGFSSTASEAIWPLAILDCEEKRGAVRLLTRPLRVALEHLQKNGCYLPEEYSRHFYNADQQASWKSTRVSDAILAQIPACGVASGRLQSEPVSVPVPADAPTVAARDAHEGHKRKRPDRVTPTLIPGAKKNQTKTKKKKKKKKKKKNDAAEGDVFEFDGALNSDDQEDMDALTALTEADLVEPDLAFWDMSDDDVAGDTEYEGDFCSRESCPCHGLRHSPAPPDQEREPVPMAKRLCRIELWLSADMKFLLMSLGLKCATANHACIYCRCNIHQRRDWLAGARGDREERKASDKPDGADGVQTGQARSNMFPFIDRDHCVLDVLHLLLRCMDRLVHVACTVVLNVLGVGVVDQTKQAALLNETLGPVMGKVMRKKKVTFNPPAGQTTLWTLNRVTGVGYRRLLHGFKFEKVMEAPSQKKRLSRANKEFIKRYQDAWDGFAVIYQAINCEKPKARPTQGLITAWFKTFVDDYVEQAPVADENGKIAKNDPAFLASFLLTPYFHALLEHVCFFLKNGHNLRSFTGQNFERANNEHRLYWQNCNKVNGLEIPAVMRQHLRVRMNPVGLVERSIDGKWQCPGCAHPPYSYKRNLQKHLKGLHPNEYQWNDELLLSLQRISYQAEEITRLATRDLRTHITEVSIPELVAEKSATNAHDYVMHKTARKDFKKTMRCVQQPLPQSQPQPQPQPQPEAHENRQLVVLINFYLV